MDTLIDNLEDLWTDSEQDEEQCCEFPMAKCEQPAEFLVRTRRWCGCNGNNGRVLCPSHMTRATSRPMYCMHCHIGTVSVISVHPLS